MVWALASRSRSAVLAVVALGLAPAAVPGLYLAAVTPELVRIDLREHRLPEPDGGAGHRRRARGGRARVASRVAVVPLVAALAFGGVAAGCSVSAAGSAWAT